MYNTVWSVPEMAVKIKDGSIIVFCLFWISFRLSFKERDNNLFISVVYDLPFYFWVKMWYMQSSKSDSVFCFRPLLILHFISFALLPPLSGAESGRKVPPGNVCHCNIPITKPTGHSRPLHCLPISKGAIYKSNRT